MGYYIYFTILILIVLLLLIVVFRRTFDRGLMSDMTAQVLQRAHAAVILFSNDHRCTYFNQNARMLFPTIHIGMERKFIEASFFGIDDIDKINGNTIYFNEDTNEETCYLFECRDLYDRRGEVHGSYFVLTDLTSDERETRNKLLKVSRDHLTGLLNESGFYEKASRIVNRNDGTEYQLITSNIVNFKLINELMGRDKGDEILTNIGKIISTFVNINVAASRLESDHFALFIPSHFDINALDKEINDYLKSASTSLSIVCYFGIYIATDTSVSVPIMCENANLALATITEESAWHYAHFNEKLRDEILSKNELIADMEAGLKEHQFILYFQPQVDSFSEKVVGAEALVRWQHPTRGFLTPYHFVELFEKHGRLYDLDVYVWEEACATLKALRDQGYPISISVNISPKDIFNHDLHSHFVNLVKKYDLRPRHLKLEITESAAIFDMKVLIDLVKSLRTSGFVVEMDDFGSGYSSLNSLKDIPVDIIKTDMLFMKDFDTDGKSRFIFDSILGLARKLGTPIIAEGVETEEQLNYLRSIGCHNIQGYYYSPPVPLDKFKSFMDEHGVASIKI